jgi:hypothetical protein
VEALSAMTTENEFMADAGNVKGADAMRYVLIINFIQLHVVESTGRRGNNKNAVYLYDMFEWIEKYKNDSITPNMIVLYLL